MGKSKTVLPQNSTDRMLFTFMIVGIPFAAVWLGCVVLPHYHDTINTTVVLHITAAAFIFYNIFHNILLVIRTDASGRTSYLPSVLKPGWRYCAICQVNYPPRSYHCHICDECILKRDHHCKFTGCCIGYHNHRYFLIGILYVFIGAVYGIYYQWDYVYSTINLPVIYFFMTLLAPHFALLFGAISLWGVLVATLHTLGLITLLMVSYLLVMQVKAICLGQTQYEMKHGIHDYNLSLYQNLVDVLGRRWKIAWVSPFINSPLKGDGINFLKANEYELPKDI
ncbi:probable palmitoyltransferase ZDHHC24 [Cherax quadricarinatus]|uniref:probable palmitoyltransferase ZDHHC24 n=1 Tax=Cherax quadricarinatus TaxID=27406 RepID=UPI00237814F0|nr:probable palmitoyltransferase ZDHHC24 [Cherax quadricarinatus]XP_053635634.1 probable palmitoyltransferase ZDHHC24 [Cherax quadricarinatus]XP_053635635.1 probable palmitoyltransferase ZDHHC24 [Cherax quadricarinatus]